MPFWTKAKRGQGARFVAFALSACDAREHRVPVVTAAFARTRLLAHLEPADAALLGGLRVRHFLDEAVEHLRVSGDALALVVPPPALSDGRAALRGDAFACPGLRIIVDARLEAAEDVVIRAFEPPAVEHLDSSRRDSVVGRRRVRRGRRGRRWRGWRG